jgi:NADP-dependent 3-hydroxy acid dehydrogenase YdfG
MSNTVKNKVVVITGASSGIGEATARLLAAHGARVVLGARRTERLEQLAADIRKAGGSAEFKAVNVVKREEVAALVRHAQEKFGRIDVMFNNAGVMLLAPLNELKMDEWDRMVDINIKGVLNGIAAALPAMEAQGSGHIINTASTGAYSTAPGCGVYCATKYAVRAITEGLRQETDKVKVTLLSPGVTETELGHDISNENAAAFVGQLRQKALQPETIAQAVLQALSQPDEAEISEVVVRPARSVGHAF